MLLLTVNMARATVNIYKVNGQQGVTVGGGVNIAYNVKVTCIIYVTAYSQHGKSYSEHI